MPWGLSYTFRDEPKDDSVMTIYFNNDLTVLQVGELNLTLQGLLRPLTNGGIVNAEATLGLPVTTGYETIADTSRVSAGARFIWNVTGGYKTSFRLPTRLESIITDGSKNVDLANPDVAALVTALEGGITVTLGTATMQDYRGTLVTTLSSAKEASQSQRR